MRQMHHSRHIICLLLACVLLPGVVTATVEHTEMVSMRDGTRLSTKIFRPDSIGSWPTVLMRTPYDKSFYQSGSGVVQGYMSRGYSLVVQDTRGRFASEGVDSTFWTDGWGTNQDGYDTIEWIAAQPWCDGNIGMNGGSALGIVQMLAAGALPPHLKACFAMVACEDFYEQAFFQGGEFRKSMVEGWMESQGSEYMIPFFTDHPTRDAFWDTLDLETRVQEVDVPIVHLGGHYDIFGEGAIDGYIMLQALGGPGAAGRQRLVMGPWQHRGEGIQGTEQGELTYPENSLYDYRDLRWRWYERWLKGIQNGVELERPIEVYLMGDVDDPGATGNIWWELDEWPPPTTEVAYYFHHTGELDRFPPMAPNDWMSYDFDPSDPIPTLGGRNLNIDSGPYDQRPLSGRPDQLVFRTEILEEPVIVTGKVQAVLYGSSSALDTDWTAKLVDVYPDGREMLVTDGILRARFRNGFEIEELLEADSIYTFTVDLWSTALAFDVGHRIEVILSSSNYPRFEANPNDGLPFGAPHKMITCENRIHMNQFHPSHLMLPVLREDVGVAQAAAQENAIRLAGPIAPGGEVRFTVDLLRDMDLRIGVYGPSGRRIRALHSGRLSVGRHGFAWPATNATGAAVAPGVYFLHIGADAQPGLSRKVVIIR